jgi:hypothetical protein
MNNRRVFLHGLAACAGLLLSACDRLAKDAEAAKILATQGKDGKRWPDYRYRLTVEVDTPEGVKTGSSVIEVRTAVGGANDIPSPGQFFTNARGEAVMVDLGKRGMLFALLRSEAREDWATRALHNLFPLLTAKELRSLPEGVDDMEPQMERIFSLPLDKAMPLPRRVETGFRKNNKPVMVDNYPMLVRFDDPAKPETVKRVDADDLAATFGDGVRLKAVTIARTTAPVKGNIERTLPWLYRLANYRTNPENPFTNTLPNEIGYLLRK